MNDLKAVVESLDPTGALSADAEAAIRARRTKAFQKETTYEVTFHGTPDENQTNAEFLFKAHRDVDLLLAEIGCLRSKRDAAVQAWKQMRGDLDRSITECAGLLRIKRSEYYIAKSSDLKAEMAFLSGKVHAYEETRAALDHYFPVYFYTFFDSVTGEPRTASVSGIDSEPTQETDAHE